MNKKNPLGGMNNIRGQEICTGNSSGNVQGIVLQKHILSEIRIAIDPFIGTYVVNKL